MNNFIRRKTLASLTVVALAASIAAPAPFATRVQAASDAAPVTASWYDTHQTMDGVGAAYAYTDSIHMLQLATAGHQDTVRKLLNLTFDEKNGTGHDIVRVIIGDNGGLTASGTASSPGFNPVTGLLADVTKPGFDIGGNAIPMRGTAGQYGYKMEAENRYYDGNTDSIWPVEPAHPKGTLVPLTDFVWDYPSWNTPIRNDSGGPTNLLSAPGEAPVVMKNSARTRKELFDFDQVWTMLQAQQYGVKQFYACVWTVPYWMSNSSSNSPSKIIRSDMANIDGKDVKIYYQAFADYLVHYIKGMWEQWGIPITHINPFNEVDLAGGTADYVKEIIDDYVGPALKKAVEPGGALYEIKDPKGKAIDFTPQLAAVDGTNLAASISRGGKVFSETDEATATPKNPFLDVFTTHLYGTVNIGTDENKLYHTGDFAQRPLDYTIDSAKYPEYLTRYKLWQAEFMNQDTGDGSAGAYTQRYGNQNINDAVRWSNLMTNMFTSNPGFNGFVWWSMWDSNGADGSDLIRFVHNNSQQEPGRISTLTGEYRIFKRFYGYGHYSRFMNPGDKRMDVTRSPVEDINIVGFKNDKSKDYSITITNAKNNDSVQPLVFTLEDFPAGTNSVTVFRTSGSENQKKLGTIPVSGGKFTIDIPSASIVTVVPSNGTYATFNGLDGERDIFSSLEAESNDNGIGGDTAGNAGRSNEAVTLTNQGYLAYKNLNFADGSANGGVVRRHLLYLTAQAKSAEGGSLEAYVLPTGTAVGGANDILAKGRKVADITIPAGSQFGKYQDMMDTGDLSAYGIKDLYIVAASAGPVVIDRFLFGANDSDWSTAANNSTVAIPGNLLLNGDFDTATAASADNWTTGRYDNGVFTRTITGPVLSADTIQSYSGLSRYLKNGSTSKVAGSAKIASRTEAPGQYDGMWQDVTGKLEKGESYDFKGYFLSMKSRPESFDVAAEQPGDVEVALVYYDSQGNQLGLSPISGRDMPEPYPAREAGDAGYWSNGAFIGRVLEGGPMSLSTFQPLMVKVADWHESDSTSFVYDEPEGTAKVVLAVYAKDANILYADQLSLVPEFIPSYTVMINGAPPANFDPNKYDYSYPVTGETIPVVTASSTDPNTRVSISQADSTSGTAIVRFVKGQHVKTYTIAFSTTQLISFAGGLPVGWTIANPVQPEQALAYNSSGSVTMAAVKGDAAYPGSSNMLQFPGSAEGNWTLTAKISVNKALSDASFTDGTQVGLGISNVSTGEFFRLNGIRVGNSVKVNSTGKTGSETKSNTTSQTSLNGTDYYLRVVKTGNDVQGYFSTNGGSSYTIMSGSPGATVPTTYTPDFFTNAKLQLYGTNVSSTADLLITFANVTLSKSSGGTAATADQLAVEQAAALIGSTITVPNALNQDPALKAKAQQWLDQHSELKALGVQGLISGSSNPYSVVFTKGKAVLNIPSITLLGGEGDDKKEPVWPEGSSVKALEVTSGGAVLAWTPAEDESGIAGYRIYNGVDTEPVTVVGDVYGWQVIGLKPATAYTFKIEAGDQAGNWSVNGPSVSIVTPPAADVTPPVWPEGSKLEVAAVTSTEALLSWTEAKDESGVAGYRIYNGVNPLPLPVVGDDPHLTVTQTVYTPAVTEAVYGVGSVTRAVYSYRVTGLAPETEYVFTVQAGDTAGNWTENGPSARAATQPAPDTSAPVWAGGSILTVSGITQTSLVLSWSGASDNKGVAGYRLYRNGSVLAELEGTAGSYTVSGLTAGTEYTFLIQAGDAAGNWSTGGPSVVATTLSYSEEPGSDPDPEPETPPVTPGTPGTPVTPPVTTPVTPPAGPGTPSEPQAPAPAPGSSVFADVDSGLKWADEAIGALYAKGIIQGTSDTTFSPERNVTRADFVVLMVRALGLKAGYEGSFMDVQPDDYYYEALAIAKKLGIINGLEDGRFNPRGEISRQDMMVIAARALEAVNKLAAEGNKEDLKRFADASDVAEYAAAQIAALVKEGIVEGDGSSLYPTSTATRAEAAVLIYRIYKK